LISAKLHRATACFTSRNINVAFERGMLYQLLFEVSQMKRIDRRLLVGVVLVLSSALPGVAAGPPEIQGNKGVPGFLAKITTLESDLGSVQQQLTQTEGELTATKLVLTSAQAELNLTKSLLTSATSELEAERNLYRIPVTGQTDCWDSMTLDPDDPHYSVSPCAIGGEDGDIEAGLAPPALRFIDNGDGIFVAR
jgi:hypothetical protein